MFECFRQGESGLTRRYSDLGLGLALAQALVHLMGGEVEVKSSRGKGTILPFWAPFKISRAGVGIVLPSHAGSRTRRWGAARRSGGRVRTASELRRI